MNISMKTGRVSFNTEEVQDMHGALKRARDILDAFEKGMAPKPKQIPVEDYISYDVFSYRDFLSTVRADSPLTAQKWAAKVYGGVPQLYTAIVTK